MKRAPTFELLRERRELPVIYPATGARFTISLRDWQRAPWAVRMIPLTRRLIDRENPFVTAHRILSRPAIEEWLERLRVVKGLPGVTFEEA